MCVSFLKELTHQPGVGRNEFAHERLPPNFGEFSGADRLTLCMKYVFVLTGCPLLIYFYRDTTALEEGLPSDSRL